MYIFKLFIRSIPWAVGLGLSIFLPKFLDKKTAQKVVDEHILNSEDTNRHIKLVFILEWRDLIIATLTGMFVLIFSAADGITSTSRSILGFSLPDDLQLSYIAFAAVLLTALAIGIVVYLLVEKMPVSHVNSRCKLVLRFIFFVGPWYLLSVPFIISSVS